MTARTQARTTRGIVAVAAAVALAGSVGSASAAPTAADATSDGSVGTALLVAPAMSGIDELRAAPRAIQADNPHLARSARQQAYARFTTRSAATRDMRGVERSLYRGRYYRPSIESRRVCIAHRESEGHYGVVSPSGLYFGAYQVSRALGRGATWMMLPEHRRLMGAAAARTTLARLRTMPMNRWPRYWQDAAFSTVMNWDHTGSGASHWGGGRWRC